MYKCLIRKCNLNKEEFINSLLEQLRDPNISTEDKIKITTRINKYLRLQIDYYQISKIDMGLSTLLVGAGIGIHALKTEEPYLPFILYGIGTVYSVTSYIKRKIKYKLVMDNFTKNKVKTLKKEI